MNEKTNRQQGFCILCHEEILINVENPYCLKCRCSCSSFDRASSSVMPAYYCHICGDPSYVSDEKPVCDDCKKDKKLV